MNIQPFRIAIPQEALDDLRERLSRARWPQEIPGTAWQYGVSLELVRQRAAYWQNSYDWRAWETKLNAYPQYITEIDGQTIHFLHIRSPQPNAVPLLVTHGWPGTFVEFLPIIEPLSTGGQAFHLVIPSLPGFAFSGPTHEAGWNPERIAKALMELMRGLGYDRYGAVGNDWGSDISQQLAHLDAERLIGAHVTQIFLEPSDSEAASLPPEDMGAWEGLKWLKGNLSSYAHVHREQPQTLAFALSDSPVGLLAWFSQLCREEVDLDFILTNASIYWFTETIASAARLYYEDTHMARIAEPTTIPIGVTMFANDFRSFRSLAERAHSNIVHWGEYDRGGHWAAYHAPELLVDDVRKFFAPLR
jgi:epoxide hydrolase